ncbi:hypothetical protein VTK73DRAFT_7352 [Phialemonium thermophilum]|uniref:Uncharacterized protein n=1 Tax=Phialemonium thermophilum TaxID=223376 RepID=A0ABR3WEZ4_9PEZI
MSPAILLRNVGDILQLKIHAVAGLLNKAIAWIIQIRKATQRQANVPVVISEYFPVVKTSKSLFEFVRMEPLLASPNVTASVNGIRDAA